MKMIFSHSFYKAMLFLAACPLALILFLATLSATAQELSRAEAMKKAGRLGTEAERIRGEAHQQVRAGGDRKLIHEAERAAAEKLRSALELWRTAGDDNRLIMAAEELSRIYFVLNDYESAVGTLRREMEFWRERGDVARQVHITWLIGIRQMQMRRDDAATKTIEEVIEMSRNAHLGDFEANALNDLARLYEQAGRGAEAATLKAKANELWEQMRSQSVVEKKPREPLKIPAQWFDFPTAPLVAEYRELEGVRQAVLVNRSAKGIEMVGFGCVKEQDGKAHVVGELGGMGLNHGGVAPGNYYESFAFLNGPLNQWTDEKMGCEGKAKMAVIRAIYADGAKWEVEGADWTGL
ncbi:MAG TPA: hypothetical protein VF658_00465 [Pyrinomonadaceae bacterium]|jgi:tetratricopeptide (TPR) repeat protein